MRTQLSPYADIWRHYYGGDPEPWGLLAKVVAVVEKALGKDQALLAWDNFCKSTPAQYVSIPKFARTFGAWCPSSQPISGSQVVTQLLSEGLVVMWKPPKEFASQEAAERWKEDYRAWLKSA